MYSQLPHIALCLLVCCTIMSLVWVWAQRLCNASVVDIFWSYNFPVIALLLVVVSPGFPPRKLLLCCMVAIAGIRLGTHLLLRIIPHLQEEEGRYQVLRKSYGAQAGKGFFRFFQYQAISNVLLATPFFIAMADTRPRLLATEYLAAGIWMVAVMGEAIADWQLKRFKRQPANKGMVCDTGLWRYSRHPNYFFQWLLWVAYALFCIASPYGYLAVFSPAIMLYLLLRVTGIPATEEQSIRTKGEAFRRYQQTTSAFVPWFKRKQAAPLP